MFFFLEMTAVSILIAVVHYWLLISTLLLVLIIYLFRCYMSTGRSMQRLESLTRSQIYSHANATVQGLSIIRVFKAEDIVEKEFQEYMDHNTAAFYLQIAINQAFSLWLDFICVIYITIVTCSFLFRNV